MKNLMSALEAYVDARITLSNMRAYEGAPEHRAAKQLSDIARTELVTKIRGVYMNPSRVHSVDGNG
jgi:hypothetical protein